jgi:hypothetical protein
MSQVYPLDNVIRLSKRPGKNQEDSHMGKLIILDVNRKKVLGKDPKIKFGRDLRYYYVFFHTSARNETEYRIGDFPSDQSIVVKIKYEAKVEPQNEETVVLSLYDGNNPGVVLNNLIENWIRDFIESKKSNGVQPILDFYNYRVELMEYLCKKASQDAGISIEFSISLKYEEDLKEVEICSDNFPVRVKGYDDEINLAFKIGLAINEKNKIYAILNYTKLDSLEKFLQSKLKGYILENTTLDQFVFDLNGTLKDDLKRFLNEVLKEKGREVAWFKLESEASSIYPLPQKFLHLTRCDISDYSKKVEIHHKLLMQLNDLAKYNAKKKTGDLEKWVTDQLDTITQDILFDKKYVELVLDFDQPEDSRQTLNAIKEKMQDRAESIGYSVKHLIVDPDLKPLKLRDGFEVELKEANFATLDNRVDVGLGIVVTGKIKDLKKVAEYIKPDVDIIEEMRLTIIEEVRTKMHEINPERFYMPFNYPEKETVPELLQKKIAEKLNKKFYADEINVIIKILDTDLINRITDLIKGNLYRFEINVSPRRSYGHRETVPFKIEFEIQSVAKDGWHNFLNLRSEPLEDLKEKITKTIADEIVHHFQKIPVDVLLANEKKVSETLLEIANITRLKIADVFGLDVFITQVSREDTFVEKANQAVFMSQVEGQKEKERKMLEINHNDDLQNLEELLRKRSELLDPDIADEEKIANIDKKISEIRKKSSHPVDKGKKILAPVKDDSDEKWDIASYYEEIKNGVLPPARNSRKAIERGKNGDE